MLRGLQVTMSGKELRERIQQRIRLHADKLSVLDDRIRKREGDQRFDVRLEDGHGLASLGELEDEREHHWKRVEELTLFRERLTLGETFTLGLADLRAADLISPHGGERSRGSHDDVAEPKPIPIDGLKLTIAGERVRQLLERQIESRRACAARWKRELARTPAEQTEDEPLLPDHMCENEAERYEWRAEVLEFIREHIDATEVYRLGEADLTFGELLPDQPGWLEQADYEERTAVGFNLERLVKKVGA